MSDLRTLIEAAKADAPSGAARANVWAGVSTVVGEAVSAASSAGSAAAGTAGSAKMLVLGTLLGGSVTVGIGAVMLFIGHGPARPATNVAAHTPASEFASLARPALTPVPVLNPEVVQENALSSPQARGEHRAHPAVTPAHSQTRAAAVESAATRKTAAASHAIAAVGPVTDSDTLAREASSLAEARGALARHDAVLALQIVRGLRALPGRQLVPEELAVEAQALRGLGLDDDASAVEARLRVRFPDSVLGR
jgi:hypothetical protein